MPISKFRAILDKNWTSKSVTLSLESPKLQDFFQIIGHACLIKDQQDDRAYQESAYYITHDFEVWWYVFQKNLQHFVSLVTSKKGYFKVEENLQTLEATNENRMRYVAIMQQTIQQLNTTIREQQQVITALKFRYLLENLPGPAYADIDKFGERWKKFWVDVATYYRKRDENVEPTVANDLGVTKNEALAVDEAASAEVEVPVGGGQALAEMEDLAKKAALPTKVEPVLAKPIQIGEKAPVKGVERMAPTKKGTSVGDNHTITTPALEKLFKGRHESKYENKGRDLYSDLSEIIHRYKGNNYEIPELLFDPITSDILRA